MVNKAGILLSFCVMGVYMLSSYICAWFMIETICISNALLYRLIIKVNFNRKLRKINIKGEEID